MRRAFIGVAMAVFTVLAVAGPASAAPGQVTQDRFNGAEADAAWNTSSASSTTTTIVNVSQAKQGSGLFLIQVVVNLDADGNITGGTQIEGDGLGALSFAIDQGKLASATLSASGVPANRCILDADLNVISCSPTTIGMKVSWTGQGPITRGVLDEHSRTDGVSYKLHLNGTDRSAVATGTVAGVTVNASDLALADLSILKSGEIDVCVGASC